MTSALRTALVLTLLGGIATGANAEDSTAPRDLAPLLEPIVADSGLPGLAAAVTDRNELLALGAAGVRRRGSPIRVTASDRFHLGSCTKALTAALVARLVEAGAGSFDATLPALLPEASATMAPAFRAVTLAELLSARASGRCSITRTCGTHSGRVAIPSRCSAGASPPRCPGARQPYRLKASLARLTTPVHDQEYALGWVVANRSWAGGDALHHAGGNTMFFAVVWAAPKIDRAYLVATNQGGEASFQVLDRVVAALVHAFPAAAPPPSTP